MIWTNILSYALLVAAGAAAGLINSIAGGGTLVTFPTLLWLGRNPVLANASNTIALWPGSLTGMIGFRREMAGTARIFPWLAVPSLLGGISGAVLLVHTPERYFSAIVPWLIFFSTLLIMFQEKLRKKLAIANPLETDPEGAARLTRPGMMVLSQYLIGLYGGYFGAGIGILMLALLGLLGHQDLHRMNGLKNGLAMCINGVAAFYFVFQGAVIWGDSLSLMAGSIVGAYGGAGLARRLGREFVRKVVIAIGLFMTVSLFLRSGG